MFASLHRITLYMTSRAFFDLAMYWGLCNAPMVFLPCNGGNSQRRI